METALDVVESSMNWGWAVLIVLGIVIFLALVCYGWEMIRLFFKF